MTGLCCIFNYPAHYRLPIYTKIAEEMNADFYFGANLKGGESLEKLDAGALPGYRGEKKVHFTGSFRWTGGWLKLAFCRKYDTFLITQDLYAVNQWLFAAACRMLGKRIFVWGHGIRKRPPLQDGSRTTRILRTWYDRFVCGYFLYSEWSRENMWLNGFDAGKLHVIYNSLDYSRSASMRKTIPANPYPQHFGNDFPVIAFVGRLTGNKRLEDIIRVHDILRDSGIETNVVFVGDGPQMRSLKEIADGNVWFAEAEYDEDRLHEYLYHAALCLSPGNVGLTAVNCLSHGLPVITHDDFSMQMPEFEAITPGVTGDFHKAGDLADMVAKTKEWLRKLSVPEAREAVRAECYKVIDEKYNPYCQVRILKNVMFRDPASSAG